MGKLIDADILIDSIPDLSVFEEEDFCTSDMIHLIEDATPVEAIPKTDYEARLKADTVAILDKMRGEIEKVFCMSVITNELRTPMEVKADILQILDKYKAESEE